MFSFRKAIGRLDNSQYGRSNDSQLIPPRSPSSEAERAELIAKADRARDSRDFSDAARFYAKALEIEPQDAGIQVQLGNMRKDSEDFVGARAAYCSALELLNATEASTPEETSRIRHDLADLFLQLGHLFKLTGQRHQAIGYYREAYRYENRPEFINEVRIARSTTHGIHPGAPSLEPIPAQFLKPSSVLAADGAEPSKGEQNIELVEAFAGVTEDFLRQHRQCVCWSLLWVKCRQHDDNERIPGYGRMRCEVCGTEYSDQVTVINSVGLRLECEPETVTAEAFESVLRQLNVETAADKVIALYGAHLQDPGETLKCTVIEPELFNNGIEPGYSRCSADVVVLWNMSKGITNQHRLIDEVYQVTKPNGQIVFGFERSTIDQNDLTLFPRKGGGRQLSKSAKASAKASVYFRFNPRKLLSAFEVVRREATFISGFTDADDKSFGLIQKSGKFFVAVMSGIGDAVWSFVIAEAVRKKYNASTMVYVVHDSRDGRRKRSNNMLARFGFVDDMVSDVFNVHADTPMDSQTGHLNYHASGPTMVGSAEPFDYRLIVNTYLEHGKSFGDICKVLGLDASLLDFDFFNQYKELPQDLLAVNKVRALAGDKYCIFYYGALIDNTEGGLNRGGLWSPEDWNELGRMIHERYGCKIVIIGASYDLEYSRQIQSKNDDLFYVNTIGQLDITETLALIQRSQFIVSFPAGVGIVGPYMRVPTVIFWRPKHSSYHIMHDRAGFEPAFSTNWAPPEVVANGSYYPAWYGVDTPETVFAAIVANGWWDREASEPIGVWPNETSAKGSQAEGEK